MYNFTDPSLLPNVTCNVISSEGYEVTNLISSDSEKRRRGFMVYNAIKPPVEITFQFICNINLSHICIWPTVGSQKSCGFEIEFKTSNGKGTDEFISVGQCSFGFEPGIVFLRRNYRDSDVAVPSNFVKHFLVNKQNTLSSSDCLKIKIYRTFNSSLASLGRVEVWGTVSSSCTHSTKKTVGKLYSKRTDKESSELSGSCVTSSKSLDKTHHAPHHREASGLIIPDDFKDAITFEIMSIPMILPCGKVVDRSTLEKHERNEARWGRSPSDPFTGKLFSNNSHPVLAPALKARIDKFLVDNSDCKELFTVARTSGRREKNSLSQCACADTNKCKILVPAESDQSKRLQINYNNTSIKPSFEKSNGDKHNNTERSVRNNSATPDIETAFFKTQNNEELKMEEGKRLESFDEFLESRLNLAVKSALANRPSFLNCDNLVKRMKTVCSDCDGDQLLYVLPCKHLFCRPCLLKKATVKAMVCSVCKFCYTHSDPCRYHV